MKKSLFVALFLLTSLCSYSQGWDIMAWIMHSRIEDMENDRTRQDFQPLIDSYKGQYVTLHRTNNVYRKFDYKRKDTKNEIDEDDLDPYINKSYFVKDVIYDVEDFFNMGFLYVLVDENNNCLYLQRGYRNILDNLAFAFNDVYYSKDFFDKTLQVAVDKFEHKTWWATIPLCIKTSQRYSKCLTFVERHIQEQDTIYVLDIVLDSGREVTSCTDCFINLTNGHQLRFYDLPTKKQYNNSSDSFRYGISIPLSPDQFEEFTTTPMVDIRIFGIDITNISNFYGKMFQYICKTIYER